MNGKTLGIVCNKVLKTALCVFLGTRIPQAAMEVLRALSPDDPEEQTMA